MQNDKILLYFYSPVAAVLAQRSLSRYIYQYDNRLGAQLFLYVRDSVPEETILNNHGEERYM